MMDNRDQRILDLRNTLVAILDQQCIRTEEPIKTNTVSKMIACMNIMKDDLMGYGLYDAASEIRGAAVLMREYQRDIEREEEITDA